MDVRIHIDSMKAAEDLSIVCRQCGEELFLRAGAYCIDPKSTLGILAIMYSAPDQMTLDTGDLKEPELSRLLNDLKPFRV